MINELECEDCNKKRILAGQAFRKYICAKCFEETYHENTYTPKLCPKCSRKFNRCRRCIKIINKEKKDE